MRRPGRSAFPSREVGGLLRVGPFEIALIALASALLAAATGPAAQEVRPMSFQLESPAFAPGGAIPVRHTCDGEDLSPALAWSAPPAGTKSLALIVDDPDAPGGDWVHWVLFDLAADLRSLPEGIPPDAVLEKPAGARQGRNDFRRHGWGGPCPPPGKPHRYVFKLHALDAALRLPAGATKAEVERALRGHVLAKAEIVGTYARRR